MMADWDDVKKGNRPTSFHFEGRPLSTVKAKGKQPTTTHDLAVVPSHASNVSTHSKIQLVHLEDLQKEKQTKPTKKQKFIKHLARFWCCYILGGIILLAVGLPILFLVIVPALAQRLVDDADLPIHGGSIIAMSDSAVKIGLDTSLSVPSGITVNLDAFELWLYNKDTPEFQPWSMVPMEEWSVSGNTEISIADKVVGVGNRTELDLWLTDMLYNKESAISAKGNTTAHLGALSFDVKLDKTVSIDGLWSLNGYTLTESRLLLPPREEDGVNIVGKMMLPNWSILDIGLGNLTFNAWAGDVLLANVAVYDVFLEPGNTTMPFEGTIFLDTVFNNLVDILSSQASALTAGSLEVGISGNSTMVDGEHITYLESVLNKAHFLSRVPVTQLVTDFLAGVQDGSVKLDGLLDVIGDGLGPVLDNLLGGGDDEEEGEEGDVEGDGEEDGGETTGIPFDDIFGDLLDELDGSRGDEEGEGGDDSDNSDTPLGDLLEELGSDIARLRVRQLMRQGRSLYRPEQTMPLFDPSKQRRAPKIDHEYDES